MFAVEPLPVPAKDVANVAADVVGGLKAAPARCQSGDHGRPRRHTHGVVAVPTTEVHPPRGKRIQVRGLHVRAAVAAKALRLHLIGTKNKDVGSWVGGHYLLSR